MKHQYFEDYHNLKSDIILYDIYWLLAELAA
jgi:hypothetical protein